MKTIYLISLRRRCFHLQRRRNEEGVRSYIKRIKRARWNCFICRFSSKTGRRHDSATVLWHYVSTENCGFVVILFILFYVAFQSEPTDSGRTIIYSGTWFFWWCFLQMAARKDHKILKNISFFPGFTHLKPLPDNNHCRWAQQTQSLYYETGST